MRSRPAEAGLDQCMYGGYCSHVFTCRCGIEAWPTCGSE
ncbi:hypothetical protein LG3211_3460 [Lysobacter gummosus]|nr:hypothetical protein LG3211_3460 [Lysobacter gummosus]